MNPETLKLRYRFRNSALDVKKKIFYATRGLTLSCLWAVECECRLEALLMMELSSLSASVSYRPVVPSVHRLSDPSDS